MSAIFRIILVACSILTVTYVLYRIHKNQLRIQDSIFWIVFSAVILLLAFFPQPMMEVSRFMGIMSPVNLVFLVFIFVAYIKLFAMTSKLSMLENKLKVLTYQIALKEKALEELDSAATYQHESGDEL